MGKLEQILGEIDNIDTGTIETTIVLIRLVVLEEYSKALHESSYLEEVGDNFRRRVTEL